MSDNLEMPKTFAELEAYTYRILASQQDEHDAEVAKLKEENEHYQRYVGANMFRSDYRTVDEIRSQLSAANAACAMKDEALLRADTELSGDFKPEGSLRTQIREAISASPQQVAELERKQLSEAEQRGAVKALEEAISKIEQRAGEDYERFC